MKIGLLTYNNSANYGAVLQCYATCRILKELGHKVEICYIKFIISHNTNKKARKTTKNLI